MKGYTEPISVRYNKMIITVIYFCNLENILVSNIAAYFAFR